MILEKQRLGRSLSFSFSWNEKAGNGRTSKREQRKLEKREKEKEVVKQKDFQLQKAAREQRV